MLGDDFYFATFSWSKLHTLECLDHRLILYQEDCLNQTEYKIQIEQIIWKATENNSCSYTNCNTFNTYIKLELHNVSRASCIS